MDIPEMPSFLQEKLDESRSNDTGLQLDDPPIIEAVLDIDCHMAPSFNLAALEADARKAFAGEYPKFQAQLLQETQIEQRPNEPPSLSARQGLQAFQFYKDDLLQLVQVRNNGFSFNRLAPYSSFDDYLLGIGTAWELFKTLARPVRISRIALRYINRILLPTAGSRVELDEYLRIGPRLPDEEGLTLSGFLNQHSALETATGNRVNTILTTQPIEKESLPLIFDIEAVRIAPLEPDDWASVYGTIISLRDLKNRVFRNTLSERCLRLFQH